MTEQELISLGLNEVGARYWTLFYYREDVHVAQMQVRNPFWAVRATRRMDGTRMTLAIFRTEVEAQACAVALRLLAS